MSGQDDSGLRDKLSAEQYQVTQCSATERPFSGKYVDHKADGTYRCVCCDAPLFSSVQKYDSGSGWPSFWQPLVEGAVETETDQSLGMERTEVHCQRCGSHLGHVFPDGPRPTGKRFCINSLSLQLDTEQHPGGDNP